MTAPPVLLIHGFATNSARTWGETGWIDLLRDDGRDVIAPDLLGHGTAEQPTDPAAYDTLEQRVLDELPDEPVNAVGFSLGARTLLVLAAANPDRFRRLVVAGIGANLFGQSSLIDEAVSGSATADDERAAAPVARHFAALAESSNCDPAALAALLARPNPPPLDAAIIATIRQPTLVVLGDADPVGPAAPLVDALPDAELVMLRGVDHFATPKSMKFLDAALAWIA